LYIVEKQHWWTLTSLLFSREKTTREPAALMSLGMNPVIKLLSISKTVKPVQQTDIKRIVTKYYACHMHTRIDSPAVVSRLAYLQGPETGTLGSNPERTISFSFRKKLMSRQGLSHSHSNCCSACSSMKCTAHRSS